MQRAFRHDAIDGKAELFTNLSDVELCNSFVTAAFLRKPCMGILDCPLSTFDGYIHIKIPRLCVAEPQHDECM